MKAHRIFGSASKTYLRAQDGTIVEYRTSAWGEDRGANVPSEGGNRAVGRRIRNAPSARCVGNPAAARLITNRAYPSPYVHTHPPT